MPNHYLQYIPRRVRLQGRAGMANQPVVAVLAAGFDRPLYHLTESTTGIVQRIAPGDTIWLIGQLVTPWKKLPPSLDARIDVAACIPQANGYKFIAADTSCWYPLADASALLPALTTRRQDGWVAPLAQNPAVPLGQVLQQLRQLNEVEPLIKWTHTVEDQGYDFISYRLKDGTREAFNKAAALIAAGKVVFWDRWSLPRQLAEYNQRADDLLFRAYVAQTIQHANTVWGIMTPAYGEENSFSAYERLLAEKHGNFMEWPCPKTKSA